MAVKYYVGRDSQKQPWPPDFNHETHATIGIIKRLWQAFNREKDLFAIVVNLHRPSADMVIISKRGLGVVELKHYPGRIFQKPDGTWCAGSTPIKAGAKSQGYRNPHEQVQAYAKRIRRALILSRKQPPLLPGDSTDWERFKFQTAVCFTHPSAIIEDFKEALRHRQRPKTEKWEEFKVRKPDEMPEWTTTLRFEASMGHEHDYEPHCLTAEQIMNIATRLLHGT